MMSLTAARNFILMRFYSTSFDQLRSSSGMYKKTNTRIHHWVEKGRYMIVDFQLIAVIYCLNLMLYLTMTIMPYHLRIIHVRCDRVCPSLNRVCK